MIALRVVSRFAELWTPHDADGLAAHLGAARRMQNYQLTRDRDGHHRRRTPQAHSRSQPANAGVQSLTQKMRFRSLFVGDPSFVYSAAYCRSHDERSNAGTFGGGQRCRWSGDTLPVSLVLLLLLRLAAAAVDDDVDDYAEAMTLLLSQCFRKVIGIGVFENKPLIWNSVWRFLRTYNFSTHLIIIYTNI